jgi:transposase
VTSSALWTRVASKTPPKKKVHVILDNYCIHKNCDQWLKDHPNFKFHFTPTSASYLNPVELWFLGLTRKALRGGSFASTDEVKTRIMDYIEVYSADKKPYTFRAVEVNGSQLSNTLWNLCN